MRRRALFFAGLFVYVWIRLGRDLLGQSAVGVTMTHATSGTPKQLEKRRPTLFSCWSRARCPPRHPARRSVNCEAVDPRRATRRVRDRSVDTAPRDRTDSPAVRRALSPRACLEVLTALGWSWQKPERRAIERDEAAIARWTREAWPRIKKAAGRGAHLVFVAESGFLLIPKIRRTWAPVLRAAANAEYCAPGHMGSYQEFLTRLAADA